MQRWPWNLEFSSDSILARFRNVGSLANYLEGQQGVLLYTGADEIYVQLPDTIRRLNLSPEHLRPYATGEDIRDWWSKTNLHCIFPYECEKKALLFPPSDATFAFLMSFKRHLSERIAFGRTPDERGLQWYEYSIVVWPKLKATRFLAYPNVATHAHFIYASPKVIFKEKAPVLIFSKSTTSSGLHLLTGLLNSCMALFWLKQICFNKGAGEDEERDRFEFVGGKVQQLPVPDAIADTLCGKHNELANRLTTLSQACWERGRQMPALAMKKLFERPGEAYHDWNSSLAGYIPSDPRLGRPFQTAEDLKAAFVSDCVIRSNLRAEMIALQEEMDWLVYEAYGLLKKAECRMSNDALPEPLAREQRPFILWQQAGGDFEKAVALIPSDWSDTRRALWRTRLEAIRDNEHIRRIEQPVYKRRWDEQWKVGNRWQCGEIAYKAEFADAFDWWLSEKAEWWLEKKAEGGPADLNAWTAALWKDSQVQAAWSSLVSLGTGYPQFGQYFKALVREQTVPADIPWAVPWEQLEKKRKVPAAVKRIRGKLNVPRERFRVTAAGTYIWAGIKYARRIDRSS